MTALMVGFAGCERMPSDEQVRRRFHSEHPSYVTISIGDVYGDEQTARIPIKYKKPGSEKVYTEQWIYQSTGDLYWRYVGKEEER